MALACLAPPAFAQGVDVIVCAGCHGMGGEGRPEAGYPRIAGQPQPYLLRQLEAYADGRRPSRIMSPIARWLSPAERERFAAHFSARSGRAPAEGTDPSAKGTDPLAQGTDPIAKGAEAVARGRILADVGDNDLRVQACQNCHGREGSGHPPHGPYLAGLSREYLASELRAWRSGARRTDPSEAMALIARQLREEDIDALAAHYAALPPPRAR